MATCKDCIHEKACTEMLKAQGYEVSADYKGNADRCDTFKNKADVVEVVRCKDCKHFQPEFVLTNDGERRPYTQEEKESGFGLVSAEKGINCGSRCERFGYWEENKIPVWFNENDFCSYGERRENNAE